MKYTVCVGYLVDNEPLKLRENQMDSICYNYYTKIRIRNVVDVDLSNLDLRFNGMINNYYNYTNETTHTIAYR